MNKDPYGKIRTELELGELEVVYCELKVRVKYLEAKLATMECLMERILAIKNEGQEDREIGPSGIPCDEGQTPIYGHFPGSS